MSPESLERARAARERGALEEARAACAEALRRSPGDAHALSLMAALAVDERDLDGAMKWAVAAMQADERYAEPHYVLGRLWELAGRAAEAEAAYREAVARDPAHARAHNNLGCLLRYLDRHEEALACFRRALAIDPEQAEANQNVATMTNDRAAQARAIAGYLRQVAADPTDARAFANLANIYIGRGEWKNGLEALDRALGLDPQRPDSHYARATLLLRLGDYAAAWPEYQWRWKLGNRLADPARRFPQPIWDGRPVDGVLFLHGEPPFGDTLQLARYARLAAQRCTSVVLECAAELRGLMAGVDGVARVVALGEPPPPFAAQAPLFALPALFGTTLDSVPWNGPYVHADAAKAAEWRRRLGERKSAVRAGLVWSGNPGNPNNADRSVPPQMLAPLGEVRAVELHSLQKSPSARPPLPLADRTAELRDFSDTAALVDALDLVITVDTAVAHLAGAMGKPVWVLLNAVPDWRYHVDRPDNPWYPSMRLYRQTEEGRWPELVERVALDLSALGR